MSIDRLLSSYLTVNKKREKNKKEHGINNEWGRESINLSKKYLRYALRVYSEIDAHFSFFEVNKRLRILNKTMSLSKLLPDLCLSIDICWYK